MSIFDFLFLMSTIYLVLFISTNEFYKIMLCNGNLNYKPPTYINNLTIISEKHKAIFNDNCNFFIKYPGYLYAILMLNYLIYLGEIFSYKFLAILFIFILPTFIFTDQIHFTKYKEALQLDMNFKKYIEIIFKNIRLEDYIQGQISDETIEDLDSLLLKLNANTYEKYIKALKELEIIELKEFSPLNKEEYIQFLPFMKHQLFVKQNEDILSIMAISNDLYIRYATIENTPFSDYLTKEFLFEDRRYFSFYVFIYMMIFFQLFL